MTAGIPAAAPGIPLRPRERVLGLICASVSGAAILGYAFLGLPMTFTVPFVSLPLTLLLVGAVLRARRRYGRLHAGAELVIRGAAWGVVGTALYDIIRPLLRMVFRYQFSPFAAIPMFGHLMTGLPPTDRMAIALGWVYHAWNGVSFAAMLALLWPRGGVLPGVAWAMLLQGLMMATYPSLLQVRLDNPGFLVTGIVGHAVWGAVVGAGLRRGAHA